MLISAYFPLKKVGGNRKSEEKSAFGTEKSKRKWKEPQEHLKAALLPRYESLFGKKSKNIKINAK